MSLNQKLFTPFKIGPMEIRNRVTRASAFEGMCKDFNPTKQLIDYHKSVAAGGVGMTSVAYASVSRSGLSFPTQLWMREDNIPQLRELTDAIHKEGAKACVQIGHCGNMTHRYTCGRMPVGASAGFNLFSPTFVHRLRKDEIMEIVKDFGNAVNLARKGGFDAVEVHAGHGYLISQFLTPFTNHRHDEFGGTLEKRMHFMELVITEVMKAAGDDMAVIVKMNTADGFRWGGLGVEECIKVGKKLEELGVHALVLSGGFVSWTPMYVMKGKMPIKTLYKYMSWKKWWWLRVPIAVFGRFMIKNEPFKEAFFLEDAKKFRAALKLPLILVGGINSVETINTVLDAGFECVSMARPLVNDPAFVNKLKDGSVTKSECCHANYCVARIWNKDMQCHKDCQLSKPIRRQLEKNVGHKL